MNDCRQRSRPHPREKFAWLVRRDTNTLGSQTRQRGEAPAINARYDGYQQVGIKRETAAKLRKWVEMNIRRLYSRTTKTNSHNQVAFPVLMSRASTRRSLRTRRSRYNNRERGRGGGGKKFGVQIRRRRLMRYAEVCSLTLPAYLVSVRSSA